MSDLERFERSLRDKLSERSFPWEDGEMDQVGAVIAQHNATPTLRGALRWWHTAFLILPFAAVWWWSQASDGTIADTEHARSAQVEQLLPLVATEPTVTADEARLDATAQSSTSASAQERVATAHLDLSKNGMRHTAARHDPLLTQTEQASRAKGLTNASHKAEDQRSPSALTPTDNTVEESTMAQVAAATTLVSDRQLVPDRMALRTVRLLAEPNDRSFASELNSATFDAALFRQRPSGELRAFYAPLANTHTLGSDQARADGPGSYFGLEYHMKHKCFSISAGVNYTAFTLNSLTPTSGEEAFATSMEYVGVPLLFGIEERIGRFGALVQVGASMNFLFNVSGTYGSASAQQSALLLDKQFTPIVISALLRPQLTYQVTESLGVSAGPLWTQQLTSLAHEGPLAGKSAQSFGLGVGLIWHLPRTTF